jgi:wyosine [tRNA(Phe)-imidazoG37] synthetase (radical SAM superfamily)
LTRNIRDLAFSGDGEPTMVPNFDDCVRVAVDIKKAHGLSDTKIVLITDAAGLDKATVRAGLRLMDENQGEVWGKLDAGTETYYRLVNRSSIRFERILSNLLLTARERPIIIQSLFFKVHDEKMSEAELFAYCDRLKEILDAGGRISAVHAYTIARPTPETWATRLTAEELGAMGDVIRSRTGLCVETYA